MFTPLFLACLAGGKCEEMRVPVDTMSQCVIWGQIRAQAYLQSERPGDWTLPRGWKCEMGERA
jgi:hypothetical protein